MTSDRQKKRGFPIPEVINPEGRLCVTFSIPDDPIYRRVLRGHLQSLAQWWTWEKSYLPNDTRAKEVAELFRTLLYDTLRIDEDCGMPFQLRQNPSDNCLLEQSLDGGLTWTTAFDYALCKGEPAIYRVVDGQIEESTDGGETYHPLPPENDPRETAPLLPPLSGPDGNDKRCQAAKNAAGTVLDELDKIAADAGNWSNLSTLTAVVLSILILIGIIGTGGALTPLLLELAAVLLSVGQSGVQSIIDGLSTSEQFICDFYCNMQPDGSMTDADYVNLLTDLENHDLLDEFGVVRRTLDLLGARGLTNAARSTSHRFDTYDCLDCSCNTCEEWYQYTFNFNSDAWEIGDFHRYWASTPAGVCDSRIDVDGELGIDLGEVRAIRWIRHRIGAFGVNHWVEMGVKIDGVDYGAKTGVSGIPSRPFWDFTGGTLPEGRHIVFYPIETSGTAPRAASLLLEIQICGSLITFGTETGSC